MSYKFADSSRAVVCHMSMVYVIQVCLSANLYDIYHCCVYSGKLLMMDRDTLRNM